jgi:D-amino-acid dehydrogenase
VDRALLARLIESARSSLQDAADYSQVDAGWAGLRPMTPSSTPIIARLRRRLIVNIGHGMLGWTLAMGSAERAAQLVMSNQTGEP